MMKRKIGDTAECVVLLHDGNVSAPPKVGTASGKKRNDASAMFLCPVSKRCLILHIEGVKPQNLKQHSALRRWRLCCCFWIHK